MHTLSKETYDLFDYFTQRGLTLNAIATLAVARLKALNMYKPVLSAHTRFHTTSAPESYAYVLKGTQRIIQSIESRPANRA